MTRAEEVCLVPLQKTDAMNDGAPPSPVEIEDALFKLMSGKGNFFMWTQLDRDDEGPRSHMADIVANKLFWVAAVTPDNVQCDLLGGGDTLSEAAAMAWINASLVDCWWLHGPISSDQYRAAPRRVPPGWEFDIALPTP